jgi:hypothetical protein
VESDSLQEVTERKVQVRSQGLEDLEQFLL